MTGAKLWKEQIGSMRIVSLLPSLTEICVSLGLGSRLVAVTHECDFPEMVRTLPHVTRSILPPDLRDSAEIDRQVKAALAEGKALYELDVQRLTDLQPDLILTQELCHVCAVSIDDVRAIANRLDPVPTVASIEPTTLREVIGSIRHVGELTGHRITARGVADALESRLERVRRHVERTEHRRRVVCLEWLDPPMVAGHWVPEMVEIAGGSDLFGRPGEPSYEVSWQAILESQPEALVLMPCGFGLRDTIDETDRLVDDGRIPREVEYLPAVRDGHVYAVDGSSYFNRPGPRVVQGVEILAGILHSELATGHAPPGVVDPVQLVHAPVR